MSNKLKNTQRRQHPHCQPSDTDMLTICKFFKVCAKVESGVPNPDTESRIPNPDSRVPCLTARVERQLRRSHSGYLGCIFVSVYLLMPRQSKPQNLVAVMLYKLNVFILNVKIREKRTELGKKSCTLLMRKKYYSPSFSGSFICEHCNRPWKFSNQCCCCCFCSVCGCLMPRLRVISDKYWHFGDCFCFWTRRLGAGVGKCWHAISWDQLAFFSGLRIGDWHRGLAVVFGLCWQPSDMHGEGDFWLCY